MYRLKLNDGTVFECNWCGVADDMLTMEIISPLSFVEIAAIFSDTTKTQKITFCYGEMAALHEGYTDLLYIKHTTNKYQLSLKP